MGILDGADGLIMGQHAGDGKKTDLHHGVDASSHAAFAGHPAGVDDEETSLLPDEVMLSHLRQMVPDFVRLERRVEQQCATRRELLRNVEPLEEQRLMAADEIRFAHQVAGANRTRAETQMRDRVMG